jgi:uncharacterized protein (DUF697 family)
MKRFLVFVFLVLAGGAFLLAVVGNLPAWVYAVLAGAVLAIWMAGFNWALEQSGCCYCCGAVGNGMVSMPETRYQRGRKLCVRCAKERGL